MSASSAIEWTDATWNPVRGCTKVSPGCANCYAETFAERFRGVKGHPYEQGFDLRLVPEKLTEPLRWKKPRRVFVNSMSDLFQDGVPDSYIDQVFAVMALCPQHTFQVLTKRAERMRSYLVCEPVQRIADAIGFGTVGSDLPYEHRQAAANRMLRAYPELKRQWPLPNVWQGVSVENQHFADERIPLLLQTPAAVRFISAEPLLGLVDVRRWLLPARCISTGIPMRRVPENDLPALDWVIVGGESGHGARPFDLAWARSIVQQCKAAGVSCFVKQLGSDPFEPYSDGTQFVDLHLKSRKGGDPSEWPMDLRVREFPR